MLTVVAALVAVASTGCSHRPHPAATPGGSGTGSSASSAAVGSGPLVPSRIVLQRSEAPTGTVFQQAGSGPQDLAALVRGDKDAAKEEALLRSAGFTDAYLALFTGLQLPQSVQQGHLVESFAAVFASPSAAGSGLSTLVDELSGTGHNLTPVATTGLPSGAVGLRSELTTISGHSYFYGWTNSNAAFLLISSGGDQAVDANSSLAVAAQLAGSTPAGPYSASGVKSLVLQADQAPVGTSYDPSRSGSKTAAQLASKPATAKTLTTLGLKAAYVSAFLSPGFLHPISSAPTNGGQGDFVASQVQRYQSADAAQRAYQLFQQREQQLFGSRMHVLSSSEFGPDATVFQYVDPKNTGDIYGFGFFWRRANLVLSLFDVGSSTFASEPQARKLAQLMDSRAH